MRVANAVPGIALLVIAGCSAGCSEEVGTSTDPVKRMFSAPYGGFIAAAGPHRSTCELALKAKGDAGKRADALKTTVEVDEIGSFRLLRGDAFELVHVGSIAWQRTEANAPLKRMEAGARPELLRDAAAAPWRPLLAPFAERVKLERTGSKQLGDRQIDVFTITLEEGGGADGGPKADAGTGTVELDVATGYPVAFSFEGGWEAPLAGVIGAAERGRVAYTVETMTCAITLGEVEKIEPPERVGPPEVTLVPSPSPSPSLTPSSKPSPKPTAKSKPKPKPKP